MRYLVVSVGRNPGKHLRPCLESLRSQTVTNMEVCAIDDASTDGSWEVMKDFIYEYEDPRWIMMHNAERQWAMANQVKAWRTLEPEDDDVIVFVDLDDALASERSLETLSKYYDQGAWMTYGSYLPTPEDHPSAKTCPPARPYPAPIIWNNEYRRARHYFNHLRTVSWRVLKHLTDEDFQNDEGEWWKAIMDPAVMVPCLEMSGRRAVFVPEVLYLYTCDGPDAVWRTMQKEVSEESFQFKSRPPKVLL